MIALADVAVSVTNAEEAAAWWEEKMGFLRHLVGGAGHAVMVAPEGDRFVLHLCEGFEPVSAGNTGIAFVSDELEALARRMEAKGVVFTEPFQKREWGGMAKFADPDGNVYWLLGAPAAFIERETRSRAGASAERKVPSPTRHRTGSSRPRRRPSSRASVRSARARRA